MIGLLNYNFLSDGNSVDPMPTNINNIVTSKLSNAVYDEFYITKDTTSSSVAPPSQWDFNTILLANFNGNLSAGNIEQTIESLDLIRVKKRVKGTFDWITIKEYPVTSVGDLSFSFSDNLSKNNTEYEYAWVPVLSGGIEGGYAIAEVLSKFNGVYIADADSIYKFVANVAYGQTQRVQQVGTFEPYGRKYPVYVSNGLINYERGQVQALLVGEYFNQEIKMATGILVGKVTENSTFPTTRPNGTPLQNGDYVTPSEFARLPFTIDGITFDEQFTKAVYFNNKWIKERYRQFVREDMVNEKNNLMDFLTNKRAKILKDYNGNYWLVIVTGNPTVDYDNNWGMGMMTAGFQWSEVGDANNANDMKSAGLSL